MKIIPDRPGGIIKLQMEKQHWEEMKEHIISCLPEEACGILAGVDMIVHEVIPVTNVLHSPSRFRMDPAEQVAAIMHMDKQGYQMLGIFHSHIEGPVHPSEIDIRESTFPEAALLVWAYLETGWKCRAFRLIDKGAVEIPIVIGNE
jgi:proteasome lid subunit RPN8/RPN11